MKFKLQTRIKKTDIKDNAQLLIIKNNTNLKIDKDLQLKKYESLLQNSPKKPNTFIYSYLKNSPIGIFNQGLKTSISQPTAQHFSEVFNWLKKVNASKTYINFVNYTKSDIKVLIPFLILQLSERNYIFSEFKTAEKDKISEIIFIVDNLAEYKKLVDEKSILARILTETKNLANLPANICTPKYLANWAKNKAEKLNISAKIFNKKEIEQIGMHSFISVAKGSIEEPYFIQLEYYGKKDKSKPVVLVGKGITFDSGGISLKPAAAMDEMKYDMCGAASVLAAFFTAVELKLPINLITLVPTCENMPSDRANKPGDIVKSLKGLSIEILNTDAEGRLILCDALTYAEKFNPQAIIDVATLTGACVIALGHITNGVMGNNQKLINNLLKASINSKDKAWQLPLFEEYGDSLKSNFADIANVGDRAAGAITAGIFLSKFVKKTTPWAHLDIAGTAWKSGAQKGSTARPVPLLVEFLKSIN